MLVKFWSAGLGADLARSDNITRDGNTGQDLCPDFPAETRQQRYLKGRWPQDVDDVDGDHTASTARVSTE